MCVLDTSAFHHTTPIFLKNKKTTQLYHTRHTNTHKTMLSNSTRRAALKSGGGDHGKFISDALKSIKLHTTIKTTNFHHQIGRVQW